MGIDVVSGFATQCVETAHNEKRDHPGITLVDMDHIVTHKTRNETADADDDDAANEGECICIDRRKCLAAKDNSYRSEAKPKIQVSTGLIASIEKKTYWVMMLRIEKNMQPRYPEL